MDDDLHFFYILAYCVLLSTHTHMSKLNYVNSNLSATDLLSRIKSPLAGWFYIFLYFASSPKNIHHSFWPSAYVVRRKSTTQFTYIHSLLQHHLHLGHSFILIYNTQHSKYSVRCNLAAKIQLLYGKSIILIFFILHWINIIIIHFMFTGCLN